MRCRNTTFPELRRSFSDIWDLAAVINRSWSYTVNRLNGRGTFTENEWKLITEEMERRAES